MSDVVKKLLIPLAALLLALPMRVSAQMKAGETSVILSGNVSAGYTDDYSNFAGSDHSVIGAGAADLSGSYFNPNFLSFDVQPFYNQSRVNSNFQSITASSGVSASAHIFGGSHYPGSVSYSSAFNSSGNFNVPGLANFTTHGSDDVLVLTWGAHPENLPSLDFTFSDSHNSYSVYGANARGTLHDDLFSVNSAYHIAGFNLNGGYQHTGLQTLTPEFLSGQLSTRDNTGANSYSFGVGHNLPWRGSMFLAATRLEISSDFGDSTYSDKFNTSIDTLAGSINFAPRAHLSVGGSTFYTDNLAGTLFNTLVTAGVTAPQIETQQSSHDLSLTGFADYQLPAHHLDFHGFVERQEQTFLGLSFASNSLNGTASYSNRVRGGSLNGVVGLTWNSIDQTGQSLLGVNGSFNYSRQVQKWTFTGGFGYSQDTQTLLIAYTTSGFNYSGNVGRRLGRRSYWGAYINGARTLLTNQPDTANSSRSYSTSLSLSRFSINGGYSQSSGNALLTSNGLVPTPIPLPIVNPTAVLFYNGKSYSAGLGAQPIRGLILSATFAKALSGTRNSVTNSNNNNENVNFLMTYNVRKLSLLAGYTRLVQGFSLSGSSPTMVGSYFVGVSRSFNFF